MSRLRLMFLAIAAVMAPWVVMCAVNVFTPQDVIGAVEVHPTRCSRACSGAPKGGVWEASEHLVRTGQASRIRTGRCRHQHRSVLPSALTGDSGMYGRAIRALYAGQKQASGAVTYGLLNIAVFVVAWPGLMLILWWVGLWQRHRIRRMKGER